jgi:hypothetical protein
LFSVFLGIREISNLPQTNQPAHFHVPAIFAGFAFPPRRYNNKVAVMSTKKRPAAASPPLELSDDASLLTSLRLACSQLSLGWPPAADSALGGVFAALSAGGVGGAVLTVQPTADGAQAVASVRALAAALLRRGSGMSPPPRGGASSPSLRELRLSHVACGDAGAA